MSSLTHHGRQLVCNVLACLVACAGACHHQSHARTHTHTHTHTYTYTCTHTLTHTQTHTHARARTHVPTHPHPPNCTCPDTACCLPWQVVANHGANHIARQNRSGGHVFDHSRLKNMAAGRDAFFRVHADDDLPEQGVYVAHADAEVYKDARGSFHGVTGGDKVQHFGTAPNGTKFFVYPNDPIGRFWQDWLSGTRDGSGRGNYIEMQIGPAPSQMQTFAMPADSHLDWTEYIMPMTGADADALHGVSYATARNAVKRWLNGQGGNSTATGTGMQADEIRTMDAYLKKMAGMPLAAGDIMTPGMAWGALEEARRKSRLTETAAFTYPGWDKEPYVQPWAELLHDGRFSNHTLALAYPPSYQTDPEWVEILLASEAKHPSWLHPLLIGIAEAEHAASESAPYPDFKRARELFAKSMDRKPNAIAARSLAVTAPTAAGATASQSHIINQNGAPYTSKWRNVW